MENYGFSDEHDNEIRRGLGGGIMPTIRCWWDIRPDFAGWYYEIIVDGRVATDSQKVDALVDADDFIESESLAAALEEAYPGAVIEFPEDGR